jgi:hypothetical protein
VLLHPSASDPRPSVSSNTCAFDSPDFLVLSILFIHAATYVRLACLLRNTIFTITISNSTDPTTGSATATSSVDLSAIPEDYHKCQNVFSKSSTSTLLPHHSYDLKIYLKEDAELPISRKYSLSEKEMVLSESSCTTISTIVSSAHLSLCMGHLSFLSRRRIVLSASALTSVGSTKFPKRIATLFHSFVIF